MTVKLGGNAIWHLLLQEEYCVLESLYTCQDFLTKDY